MWSDEEEGFASEDLGSQLFASKRKRAVVEDGLKSGPENTLYHHCSHLVNSSDSEPFNVEERPINVTLYQGLLIIVTREKVIKICKDNQYKEDRIYATSAEEEITDSAFINQYLILVIHHKKNVKSLQDNWTLLAIKLDNKKSANRNLLECKSEIRWMLPLKGRNIKSSFFDANSIESDVGNEDNLIIVWTDDEPCMIHIEKSESHKLLRRNLCSKISFLLENVVMSEEKENMESFTDLLRTITTEKKISGYLSEQQITDIQIHDSGFVMLLSCGSLILYDGSGKHLLSKQISMFTVVQDVLTAVTYNFKILTGSIQDLKQMSKASIENTFSSVSDISKKVLNIEDMLKTEQDKLDHIKIFSMIAEDEKIFDIKLKLDQENKFPATSQYRILVNLKLIDNQIKIKQGFFLFKLLVKTSTCSLERSSPVPTMRLDDKIHLNIPLEDLNLADFPLHVEGFLIMQGCKITDSSLSFVYSERILFQEISPLEYLDTKLDGTKEIQEEDQVLETFHSGADINAGSERHLFLSLLEDDRTVVQFSTKVTITPQSLDKYPRLKSLLLQESNRVVFTFLKQDVEFTAKDMDSGESTNENESREWTVKGAKEIVIMLTKYLNNL